MKKIVIAFILITSILTAQEQQYKHSLEGITKIHVKAKSNVKIISSNTPELVINRYKKNNERVTFTNGFNTSDKKEDKSKGLTPIYSDGKDNSNGLGFLISKEGNTLLIKDLKSIIQGKDVMIKIPNNINIIVDGSSLGDVYIDGFSSEIEVETTGGKIDVKNVTGPVTLYSSIGDINVDFTNINQTSPITISSSASEIDITLPAKTKASLDMETNGTVYTNFDLKTPKENGIKDNDSKTVTGNINNGGVKIKIKSSLGNIYLRKK